MNLFRKIFKFLPCLLIFVLSFSAFAQNFHQWNAINLFHGLPSDKVRAIAQTDDGLIWFGTENGLAKFDGRRAQNVPLESPQIFSLAVSQDKTLLVGTNNGVYALRGNKFERIKGTENQQINSIFASDKILFASQSGEIFELRNDAAVSLFKLDVPANSVAEKDGKIFVGTEGRGLLKNENGETKAFPNRPQPFFINNLTFDNYSILWLAARAGQNESGLFREDFARFGEATSAVSALKFDARNDLWLGTKDNGAFRFRDGKEIARYTFENTSGGLRSNQIFAVFVDREGVIWFGTDKGVSRFDPLSPFNQTFSEEPNANFVRALYKANDGKIYAGTNRGLYVFDGENWSASETYANKSIYSVGENAENSLLVGTPNDNLRAVANLKGKTYSVVFGKGLFENDKLVYADDSLISMSAENGKIYLGTVKDGILEFSDGKAKSVGILKDNAVRAISGTLEKGLWIAAEKGLYLWQNNELKTLIEGSEFRSVLAQNDKIYAGSLNKGLFQFRFDNQFGWISSNLNIEQGLPSSGVFAILPLENSLLLGTGKGVTKYSSNNFEADIIPNRVISERVHSAQEIAEGITLDYPQNTLSIEVTGLSSRTFPENFQYGYTLKNGKGETVLQKLTKDSQISFESLSPDNYSAEIRAFNQDLVSSNPLVIKFFVAKAPFPWTSTALAVLLAIAVIALVMAIIESRQIVKKNKEIAAARFDLANEAERERRRIARDLHDQTLADLRKLMLKSDKLEGDSSEFRGEIESVSEEIRRICEDLSPSVLENVGLTAALEFLLSNTFESYNFLTPDDLDEKLNFSSNVQMQIYRIAQEVLSNIKRHAEANFVEMKVSAENGFKMTIENDGKPFLPDFANLPKGRGISNIKSRAELIEAQISWENSEEGKTIFILQK